MLRNFDFQSNINVILFNKTPRYFQAPTRVRTSRADALPIGPWRLRYPQTKWSNKMAEFGKNYIVGDFSLSTQINCKGGITCQYSSFFLQILFCCASTWSRGKFRSVCWARTVHLHTRRPARLPTPTHFELIGLVKNKRICNMHVCVQFLVKGSQKDLT